MSFEHPPTPEKAKEKILSKQEILQKFTELIPGTFRETQLLEDEAGIYSLNVEIDGENPGEKIEYLYTRVSKGNYTTVTTIEVVYYDADGMPESGRTLANFIDNIWT